MLTLTITLTSLPDKLCFSSTAGGRSLTMIFSHGFGLRFDLLYALSMVCAAWLQMFFIPDGLSRLCLHDPSCSVS
jgi:hypothetical protein